MSDDDTVRERSRLRGMLMELRDRLPPEERSVKSKQITAALCADPLVRHKDKVFVYCHFRSEVETAGVIAHFLDLGQTVCVPMSLPREKRMVAVAIADPSHDLVAGYMDIPEPLPDLVRTRRVEPTAIEAAIIPGTVFDRTGQRLGYGMGFYDRFLASAPQAIRIGLAFSCQLVEKLPCQCHDVPMDMLVTEEEILVWPERLQAHDRIPLPF